MCKYHRCRFEPYAFIASDEATVIAGMLMGINIIDCSLEISVRVSIASQASLTQYTQDLLLDNYPIGILDMSAFLKV